MRLLSGLSQHRATVDLTSISTSAKAPAMTKSDLHEKSGLVGGRLNAVTRLVDDLVALLTIRGYIMSD